MINTAKLCEIVGLAPDTFQIRYTEKHSPYLVSYIEVGRQITPDTVDNENMLLYEAEMMFEQLIEDMKNELRSIKRFRGYMYGPNSRGNHKDSIPPDTSEDRDKGSEPKTS